MTILGVTHEGASLTESWIEDKGVDYAYAYDGGGKLQRWFGVTGIPHAILVDPGGVIAWRGFPGHLDTAVLEEHLDGALKKPIWEWPSAAKGVRAALAKRSVGKAIAAAEALDPEDGAEILASLRALVAGRMSLLRELQEKGDYLGAAELARALEKELSGLADGDRASEIADGIAGDKQAQVTIKAQKSFAKLELEAAELRKKREADKLIGKLDKLILLEPGPYVREQARELIARLTRIRPELK